jgi:hypothetical protein
MHVAGRGLTGEGTCSFILHSGSIFSVHGCYPCGVLPVYWACRCSVDPKINRRARKLTRTQRVIKKKIVHVVYTLPMIIYNLCVIGRIILKTVRV